MARSIRMVANCNHFMETCIRSDQTRQGSAMPADTLTSNMDRFKETALSCALPPAVELIGEKWAFLILRGALNGLHHFEEFQAGLDIARNILSDRLSKLVAGGILQRTPDPSDKRRVIYSLTPKGEALLPVVLSLRQWGEDWGYGKMSIVLADTRDKKPVKKMCVQAHDGRPLSLRELTWIEREECSQEPVRNEARQPVQTAAQ